MRRRRQKLEVSTFPFLAVLLCAMGSLILVLLIFDRRAQVAARARVAKKAAEQQQAAEELAAARNRAEEERRAEWQARQEKARAASEAEQARLHDYLANEQRQLQDRRADVLRQQAETAAAVRAEEERAAELRRQIEAERTRLLADEQNLTTRKAEADKVGNQKKEEKAGLAQAEADLISLEETVKAIKEARKREASTFSVVPYRGKHGDSRRPLYVECTAQGLVFHPDRLSVPFPASADMADQLSLGNALTRARDEVLRRVAQQRASIGPQAGKDATTGYVLFLVRPDGIVNYNLTLAALRGQPVDFGYEFVEADWVLDFPTDGQPATQPWMTARADNPPVVGTPYPPSSPPGKHTGAGDVGVAVLPGGNGSDGGPGGAVGSFVQTPGVGGPGAGGLSGGIATSGTGMMPGGSPTGPAGTAGGSPTGPALGSGGTLGQEGDPGQPGYHAVTMTRSQGTGPPGTGFGTGGTGGSGYGTQGEPGGSGSVGFGGPALPGQPSGLPEVAGLGPLTYGGGQGTQSSSGGPGGRNGPGGGGGTANQAKSPGDPPFPQQAPLSGLPGNGFGTGQGFAAGGGPVANPNPDGLLPGSPPPVLGPMTGQATEFAAGQAPAQSTYQTSTSARMGNQPPPAQSPIQPPQALMSLPGQTGTTAAGQAGMPGNVSGTPAGTGVSPPPGPVVNVVPPPGTPPANAGKTAPQGEKPPPGGAGNTLAASDGPSEGPVVPLPTIPTPTGVTIKRPAQQNPRPVRLNGDKDWVLYVECRADGVVLHPSRRSFTASTLATAQGRADLTRAAQNLLERRQNAANQVGEKNFKAQIRFLVWPDGQRTYHAVYPALDGLPAPKTMQILNPEDDVDRMTAS
jgi:hypothetical protein